MFRDAAEVQRAERDQEADSGRIDLAIEVARSALAVLASRQLDPDAMRKEWSGLRDQTMLAVRDVRHNVMRRAKLAEQTERWMVAKWLSEVNDGRILRGFTADLKDVPTRDLLDYLRYLVGFADIARIQSVSAVFAARTDNQRYQATFDRMLGQFTLAQSGSLGARIARIQALAGSVDEKLFCLFSTHTTIRQAALPIPLPQVEAPSIRAPDEDSLLQLSFQPSAPGLDRARAAVQ